MIKLIASDMDGTLLNSFNKINPEFKSVIKDLSKKGIFFAGISGRNQERLKNIFKDIDEDIIYVSDNGNFIQYKGKVLFKNTISKDIMIRLNDELRKLKKCRVSYSTAKCMYTESRLVYNTSKVINFDNNYVEDINNIKDDVIKCSVICVPFNQDKIYNALSSKFPELYIAKSGKYTIDINSSCTNKGVALKNLQKIFNVSYDETMVFGDYLNDYEMMDMAYYSYAMKNAHPKLKEKARFIAPKNSKNGVIKVIKNKVLK